MMEASVALTRRSAVARATSWSGLMGSTLETRWSRVSSTPASTGVRMKGSRLVSPLSSRSCAAALAVMVASKPSETSTWSKGATVRCSWPSSPFPFTCALQARRASAGSARRRERRVM
jgi:hypothetical protein